jgi:amino acid transporter
LALLVVIGIALWFANSILPIFLANSRLVFAMAMDRALPEFLAAVDERRGTPTWAAHLTCLFGLFGVAAMRFQWAPLLGVMNIGAFFIIWGYGLAATLLPYRKPELYELSATKIDVAGIPLVTILGFITFVLGMFFLMMSIMAMDNASMFTVLAILSIGMLIYLYQVHKSKKAGIDLSHIYSVVPPE